MSMDAPRRPVALVVDDHGVVRRALCDRIRASFSQLGMREAGCVDEALKIVAAEKVDIVLMDIHLPGMDGVSGTRLLLERSPQSSVIVVSTFDDQSHRAAASKAGAAAYVCKRCIGTELIPALTSLMNHRGGTAGAAGGVSENISN